MLTIVAPILINEGIVQLARGFEDSAVTPFIPSFGAKTFSGPSFLLLSIQSGSRHEAIASLL